MQQAGYGTEMRSCIEVLSMASGTKKTLSHTRSPGSAVTGLVASRRLCVIIVIVTEFILAAGSIPPCLCDDFYESLLLFNKLH